jgi:F-type H+-transporting ATPase subunit epsilon
MAMTMHLDIVSAEAEIFSGTCEVIVAPAATGEVGIYPRHTQLMSPLKAGEVKVTKQGGEVETFYVSGGILEVQPHTVTVLSDTCVRAHDLDEAAAIEAKQEAEAALSDKDSKQDIAEAQAKLAEAVTQLQMIEKMRKTR